MNDIAFRAPIAADWEHILRIANGSVAHVPEAGDQGEWLSNRRYFFERGIGRHFTATEDGRVTGYASAEPVHDAKGVYRLFVVTRVDERDRLGAALLARLYRALKELDAQEARFIEYETDAGFIAFLDRHGFRKVSRFEIEGGLFAAVLSRAAPFDGDAA
jgi:L-amino acid N-acyltransferase YncA